MCLLCGYDREEDTAGRMKLLATCRGSFTIVRFAVGFLAVWKEDVKHYEGDVLFLQVPSRRPVRIFSPVSGYCDRKVRDLSFLERCHFLYLTSDGTTHNLTARFYTNIQAASIIDYLYFLEFL